MRGKLNLSTLSPVLILLLFPPLSVAGSHRFVVTVSCGVTCGLWSLTTRFICARSHTDEVFDGRSWGKAGPSATHPSWPLLTLHLCPLPSFFHSLIQSSLNWAVSSGKEGRGGFSPLFFSWHVNEAIWGPGLFLYFTVPDRTNTG